MIRLVHTADVHLDRCYSSARFPSAFANRRRQSLRDAFTRIVRRAAEWPADALLVAGDLFEYDRVRRDTIAFLRSTFESAPHVPVFIAPGNHDPYLPDSAYATHPWPDNVFIFTSPTWAAHALDRVPLTVHGFGFDGPEVSRNPFGTLEVPQDSRVHVAVGHGSELGCLPPGKSAYAPFRAADATPKGLRYLALGHFHGARRVPSVNGAWVQYCGSPEGHDFGEPGLHGFVEIELDGPETRVREVPCASTVFESHTIDCTGFETSQQIVEAIRKLPAEVECKRVARITLRGVVPPSLLYETAAVQDAIRSAFDHVELRNELEAEEDFAELAREQTSLGTFIAEISAQIRDCADPRRRRMLERARELGLAAYRGQSLPLRGTGE